MNAQSAVDIDAQIGEESVTISFKGELTRHTVADAFRQVEPVIKLHRPAVFDMSGVVAVDSAGLALVANGVRMLGHGKTGLSLRGVRPDLQKTFELAGWTFAQSTERTSVAHPPDPDATRVALQKAFESLSYYLYLVSETFYHSLVSPFRGEKPRVRIFFEQMSRLGAGSAPIVWLVALLVGLTTAYQAAYELRRFGGNIYIADLVSISMMTELGPLMAAILVAGRSGAAITAEIGTMQVNEEIDAMRLIGIHPIQYLVVPRVLSVMLAQACLGVTAAVVGIFGGFIIAISLLDLSPMAFLNQATEALLIHDVLNNIMKSFIFGFIIVTVGSFYGLRVSGGAEGVGRSTTNSVVTSIFLIIVADCIYSLI